MKDLQGRVAIVTGGGSGIGRASALSLARAGVRVVVADLRADRAEQVGVEVAAIGPGGVGVGCDVTDDGSYEMLLDVALGAFGRIDIVMNNVAVIMSGLPAAVPVESWRRSFETNVMSSVRSNLVFVPLLIGQGTGHIVFTASTNPLYPYSYDRLPYTASKGAVVAMAESLALYLRPRGVGVSLLVPGPTATNIGELIRSHGEPLPPRAPDLPVLQPDHAGDLVVDAILNDRFFVPTHPEVIPIMVERAQNIDAFLTKQIAKLQ